MNTTDLILFTGQGQQVQLSQEAHRIKENALESAALIGRVENKEQQDRAVEAQTMLKAVDAAIEKARKAAVQPALDMQRRINSMAKDFTKETGMELMRLSKLIGNFQALELQRIRAEEAARREALLEAERKREAELAKARSHEQAEAIKERYEEAARMTGPPPAPVRSDAQIVREEIVIDSVDVWKVARARPDLVEVTLRKREAKEELSRGLTIPGITWHKEVKAGVRLAPSSAAKVLDV